MNGPPEQKEAPGLVDASGGPKLTELYNDGSETDRSRHVNFPCSDTVRGNVAQVVETPCGVGFGRHAGGGRPTPLADASENGAVSLGIGDIRAHSYVTPYPDDEAEANRLHSTLLGDQRDRENAKAGTVEGVIYPSGLKLKVHQGFNADLPGPTARGAITTFSAAAARALKLAFISLHVDGFQFWSFSLTTHAVFTPDNWRKAMKRFRMLVIRNGWAGIWRIEKQRRGAPHLHVAFWLPPGVGVEAVSVAWLSSTRELLDADAQRFAVMGKPIEHDDSGWGVYMGLHAGKHKMEQLGWKGKQWGMWNASLLGKREPVEFTLSPAQHFVLLRWLRNLETAQRKLHAERLIAKAVPMICNSWADLNGVSPAAKMIYRAVWLQRHSKCWPLHAGGLLRLMKGKTAERMVTFVMSWDCASSGTRTVLAGIRAGNRTIYIMLSTVII